MLNEYLDWPGVKQVFRIERERTIKGKKTTEVTYGITSLPRTKASAKRVLGLVRSHWGIENELFGVRDVTLGEDASRIRKKNAGENMATVRNLVLHMLPRQKGQSRASSLRQCLFHPQLALELMTKKN